MAKYRVLGAFTYEGKEFDGETTKVVTDKDLPQGTIDSLLGMEKLEEVTPGTKSEDK